MLTVLIATRNGAATLPRVLDAYGALQAPPQGWRLLIADNGSTDATRAVIDGYRARLPLDYLYVARPGKNVALNAALALALEEAGDAAQTHDDDLFVFSDDDAAPEPHWLRRLAAAADAQRAYSVFGGAIVPDWGAPPPSWLLELVPLGLTFGITASDLPAGPVYPGLVWGANMAVRRAVFAAGQRFDETVGPNGGAYAMGSETLLMLRLAEAGHRCWFCPDARVAHYIRPAQLEPRHVLLRAWRFGRGMLRQAQRGKFPEWWGVPRWMWRRFAGECAGWLAALLRGDRARRFRHRWELAYLRGYAHEAWLQRADSIVAAAATATDTAPKRLLVTGYCGGLGGMELRMAQEVRFLAAAGHAATLAVPPFPGAAPWIRRLRAESLDVTGWRVPPVFEQWRWRRVNKWRARFGAAWRLRRQRPDLVHVAFCWTAYGMSALWLARRCRVPAVISVHNAFPPAQFSPWHLPLMADAFRGVRGIYAVSHSAMQHFLAIYARHIGPGIRLAVIPNSVDTARFTPSAARRAAIRRSWNVAPDALVIGSVARLSEQKRPHALLDLLGALLPAFPQLVLVFIGDGPLDGALRARVDAARWQRHVVFAGFHDDVALALPGLDLHLLLSRNEGFGIATIEAMACGVPAVATDVPGNCDVLGGSAGGVLVPLDDAAATCDTVAALLRDPARRAAMGQAGRTEALAQYAHERVQEQVHAFYRGLL